MIHNATILSLCSNVIEVSWQLIPRVYSLLENNIDIDG